MPNRTVSDDHRMTRPRMVKTADSFPVTIHMAGNPNAARDACSEFFRAAGGYCVTVQDVDYVTAEGAERGFRIGLINYPRFPKSEQEIMAIARSLGEHVLIRLGQLSFTVESPRKTECWSRRPEDIGIDTEDRSSTAYVVTDPIAEFDWKRIGEATNGRNRYVVWQRLDGGGYQVTTGDRPTRSSGAYGSLTGILALKGCRWMEADMAGNGQERNGEDVRSQDDGSNDRSGDA